MNNRCLNCQAKATMKKKKKKTKEESDEDAMKQEQKVSENENPKTDSNDKKKKKKKSILTWQHSSTKKEKVPSENLLSQINDVISPCSTSRSMMYHGGPNPSNRRAITTVPRAPYPAFPMAPMYGPYGGGGPIRPYHSMPPATMYNGAQISPMGAAAPFPYWGTRSYMDSNPMKRYTSYAQNYSVCFI